ncbi:MAG: MFS transporter [Actinomycetota bacterium]|nr:MFS transporter [Actinomycetota bacterium]
MAVDEATDLRVAPEAKPRLFSAMFLLITVSTLAYFVSVGALQPVLPRFVEGPLGGSEAEVGLVVGAFAFSAVLVRPLIGPIGDRRGRRLLIILGAGIVTLSVAGYVVADSLWLLLVLRLVSGLGEACFYVGAASVVNDLAPEERRGEAVSYFSLALYLGLTIGPLLGESVFEATSFDAAWLVAAASAGVATLLGMAVRETRPDGTFDSEFRWFHPAGVLPGTILAASIWGLGGFATFIPLYALDVGLSGSRLVFVTFSGVILVVRSLGARLPDILGPDRAARMALSLQATGLVVLALWQEPAGLFAGAFVFGLGQALSFPALMTMAIRSAKPTERSAVVGTFTAFFDLSFGTGAVALGAVAAGFGYAGAFLSAAAVAVGGLVLLTVRSRRAEAAAA